MITIEEDFLGTYRKMLCSCGMGISIDHIDDNLDEVWTHPDAISFREAHRLCEREEEREEFE